MTQEQLAALLGITNVAVSKWEREESCPDISMLIPLAQIFNVSLDELMGYDAVKIAAKIDSILSDYTRLHRLGRLDEAKKLIADARIAYPNDYKLMDIYMKDIAQDNDPQTLQKHRQELLQLCDCILDGCSNEAIRLEALYMKARLEHAAGKTDAAFKILSQFPTLFQSQEQKIEQLYTQDAKEYLEWTKRNMYWFAEQMGFRFVRSIWFDKTIDSTRRIQQIEVPGDRMAALFQESSEPVFAMLSRAIFSHLNLHLIRSGSSLEAILRITEKELNSAKQLDEAARSDQTLDKIASNSGKGMGLLPFTVEHYKNAQHERFHELRSHREFMALLKKYSQ